MQVQGNMISWVRDSVGKKKITKKETVSWGLNPANPLFVPFFHIDANC